MSSQPGYFAGIIAVVIAAVLWGTTGTAATFAPQVSPLGIASVTMGVGGLLLALVAARPIARHKTALLSNRLLVLAAAVNVAIYPLAFYSSMKLSGVAVGNVISIGLAPIAAALIEWTFDKQSLNRKWLISIAFGITGVVCLATAKPASSFESTATSWYNTVGIILGLVAAFTYAMYSWIARRLIDRGIASRAAMGSMFGLGALLLMPVLLVTGAPLLASVNNFSVGLYMAVVPMFFAYLLFGRGLAVVRASLATTITLLEPVVAALLAVTIVGEKLSVSGWIGIGLISACLLIATFKRAPKSKPKPLYPVSETSR
ncbi:EamA family transporter [uncultured Alteromonas sp.]|jgi:DME family drug/metabolite transporter|uniref:DMT family transporter n=1 Tax=uncultured Alteromonas sp. TaxID=179113 RepID=UPI0025E77A97|nr:EamA family transporter [uncultured Alteromonas sp.]